MSDSANPEIDTSLHKRFYHFGVPTRAPRVSPFRLKSVLQDAMFEGKDKVHTVRKQVEQFNIACSDDPGWFMVIQTSGLLDTAKNVALNVVSSYDSDKLSVAWVSSFLKDPPSGKNLYIFDALFYDDATYRRSRLYEILTGLNSPASSVIVLARAPDLHSAVYQLGLKPHLMLSLSK